MTETTQHKSVSEEENETEYTQSTIHDFLRERHNQRDHGFLTPQDRSLLLDSTRSLDRNQRYRIRSRMESGIKDFELISHSLDSVDRKKVFRDILAEDSGYDYIVHMGALLYEAAKESDYSLERFVEESVKVAEECERAQVGITVDTFSEDLDVHRRSD